MLGSLEAAVEVPGEAVLMYSRYMMVVHSQQTRDDVTGSQVVAVLNPEIQYGREYRGASRVDGGGQKLGCDNVLGGGNRIDEPASELAQYLGAFLS